VQRVGYESSEIMKFSLTVNFSKRDKLDHTKSDSGATYHARWMSKALHCFKVFLFRKQFQLTDNNKEVRGIAAINIFVIRFYLKLWFR